MKYIWMLIIYLVPGVLSVLLIANCGLLSAGVLLAVEVILMLLNMLWKRKQNWNFSALPGALFAKIGIIIGFALNPVHSEPAELGIAAAMLTAIVHAGLNLIIEAFFKRKEARHD